MLDAADDLVDDAHALHRPRPARTSGRPPGERVRLRVDMDRVHLFDPETER